MTISSTPPNVTTPTTAEKLSKLHWGILAGGANSVFAQFTFFGPVFVLFLDELSISNTQIGFLLSLIPFTGLVALFIAPMVARIGYKRTFIAFWGTRKGFAALLVLVPWVTMQFGSHAGLILIVIIMVGFSLCRAIAETGYYPWYQEFVPETVLGKYAASNTVASNLVSIVAVAIATFVVGMSDDINRFLWLFVFGVLFGVASVIMYSRIPGGASTTVAHERSINYGDLFNTFKDRNLNFFLIGILLFTFGTAPLYSFLPLFMNQHAGLSDSNILLLQISLLIGGLVSSQFVGWTADRYGSKPIMITGIMLGVFLPIGWMLMPRMTMMSLPIALALAFFQGISGIAWGVGSGRLLFTRIVPKAQKAEYMAVYYASIGLIGGASQFIGGMLIDASSGVTGQWLFIPLDAFTTLMIISIILPALSIPFFRHVVSDSTVSVLEFAGFFFHGNPIYALGTMVRFYRAKDEIEAVHLTERLGQTNSPLTIEEMLNGLSDPRFNVRFETVISIARMDAPPKLIAALVEMLNGTELSLTVMAAWALGRIGNEKALPALREGLDSDYKSIRAQCARVLGTLGDTEVAPILYQRLQTTEGDIGLQVAYSVALANLMSIDAIPTLFVSLEKITNPNARMEIVLSMARMVSDESRFVNLLRQTQTDMGTSIAQEMLRIKKRMVRHHGMNRELATIFTAATNAFASEQYESGVASFITVLENLPEQENPITHELLAGCLVGLRQWKVERPEYLLMALNILDTD